MDYNTQEIFTLIAIFTPTFIVLGIITYALFGLNGTDSKAYDKFAPNTTEHGNPDSNKSSTWVGDDKFSRWKVTFKDGSTATRVCKLSSALHRSDHGHSVTHYSEIH